MQGQFIQGEGLVEQEQDVLPVLPPNSERKETLINYLGTMWTIVETTNEHLKVLEDTEEDIDGCCDYDSETVYVDEELVHHRKCLAITHELLHALVDSVGIPDDEKLTFKNSESLIRRLEHNVYDLVNNFPKKYKMRFQP